MLSLQLFVRMGEACSRSDLGKVCLVAACTRRRTAAVHSSVTVALQGPPCVSRNLVLLPPPFFSFTIPVLLPTCPPLASCLHKWTLSKCPPFNGQPGHFVQANGHSKLPSSTPDVKEYRTQNIFLKTCILNHECPNHSCSILNRLHSI